MNNDATDPNKITKIVSEEVIVQCHVFVLHALFIKMRLGNRSLMLHVKSFGRCSSVKKYTEDYILSECLNLPKYQGI